MTIPGDPSHSDPAPDASPETFPDTLPDAAAVDAASSGAEADAPSPDPVADFNYSPWRSGWRRAVALGATPAAIVALVAGFTVWHANRPRPAPVADPANCRLIDAKEAFSGYLGGRCWAVWVGTGPAGAHSAVLHVVVGGSDQGTVTTATVRKELTTPLAVCVSGSGQASDGSAIRVAVYRLGPQTATASQSEGGRVTRLPVFSDGGTLFAVLSTPLADDISVLAADSSGRTVATLTSAAVWQPVDPAAETC